MARFHYPNILIQYSIIRNNENLILEQWNLIQRPQITWKSYILAKLEAQNWQKYPRNIDKSLKKPNYSTIISLHREMYISCRFSLHPLD